MLIEPSAPGCLDALRDRALGLTHGQQLYLLIDGAFVPGLHQRVHVDRKIMLFAALPGCSGETLDFSPFLMAFDPEDQRTQRMLQRCSGWPMVSVIQTPDDLGTLAGRMAAWLVVDVDDQRFHFRYSDTRRIPAIVSALSPAQRAGFLGPAQSWTYITRSGAWHELGFEPGPEGVTEPAVLTAQQFAMLVEDSRIDEMLAIFSQRNPGSTMPPLDSHAVLTLALQMATKARLPETELLSWCEYLWLERPMETPNSVTARFTQWQSGR